MYKTKEENKMFRQSIADHNKQTKGTKDPNYIRSRSKSPISKVLKKETGEKPLPKRRMTEDEGVNLPRSHSFWKTYIGGKASFMKENREIKKRNK